MESKQEEADLDQETPKPDETKESSENKKDISELIKCNGRELGKSKQDSWKPRYSNVKVQNNRTQTISEISWIN